MKWLWFAGPLVVLLVYAFICIWPTGEERRLRAELARWIDGWLGPLPDKRGRLRSRRVRALPAAFEQMVQLAGGGARVTDVVLRSKLAYFAARAAGELTASNQLTVVCKLAKSAPSLLCQPLPMVDGRPADNKGIAFDKDPDFMDAFMVEGDDARAIGKWLARSLRHELLELPDVWLRVEGRMMALTLYGSADGERMEELLATADAWYAARGAKGGKSLYAARDGKGNKSRLGKRASDAVHGASDAASGVSATSRLPYRSPPPSDRAAVDEGAEPAPTMVRLKAAALDVGLYAIALLLVTITLGAVASFHPALLFNSPDRQVAEPWQGGWTTKGFGCFFGAEALLVGLLCYQAYLGAHTGYSIGGRLFGIRARRRDGRPWGFFRGVLLRRWVFALVPLGAAVLTASPRTLYAVLLRVPSWATAGAAVATFLLVTGSVALDKQGRGLHDRLAGSEVVTAPRWRLPAVQLIEPRGGADPVTVRRITQLAIIITALVIVNVAAQALDFGFWVY